MSVNQHPISFELLKPNRYARAFEMASAEFLQGSVIHREMGLTLSEYRDHLEPSFTKMADQSLSYIAIDSKNGAVVGCLLAADYAAHSAEKHSQTEKLLPLEALIAELENQYGHEPKSGVYVLVDMAVVSPRFAGRGIYKQLRSLAHARAKSAGYKIVLGELSSPATQHVLINSFGHRVCATIKYSDFDYRGKKPFARVIAPDSIVMVEGEL